MAESAHPYLLVLPVLRQHSKLVAIFLIVTLTSLAIEGLGTGAVISMLDAWGEGGVADSLPFASELRQKMSELTLTYRVRLIALALLGVVVAESTLRYTREILALRLALRVDAGFKSALLNQIYAVSLRYINQKPAAHLTSLLLMDTTRAAKLLFFLATMGSSLAILAMYTIIMLALSWKLTLLAGLLLIIFSFPSRVFVPASKLHSAGGRIVARQKRMQASATERLATIKLAHLYSREEQDKRKVKEATDDFLNEWYGGEENISRTKPLMNVFAVLGLVSLLIAASFFAENDNDAWLASTSIFLLIVFRLLGPATQLNSSHAQFANFFPSCLSIHNFLERENKPYIKNGTIKLENLESGIQFENVSFCYPEQEQPALQNVSFEIPYGKKTAIVGASGSGKSTIINLLSRLYDPDQGLIRVNTIDLRDLEVASWRRNTAVISQEDLLFNSSIMDNLKYARPDASDEEAYAVAKLAQVHEFAELLPNGYDTVIGDQGILLSGGQRQRLAIARALLADPKLLIMDEATSALDSETEQLIQKSVDLYAEGRTAVISAHRLSTIRYADNIIVLSDGMIVEQGTHLELMAHQSHYKKLVQAQNPENPRVC